jgi:hypothetical protein
LDGSGGNHYYFKGQKGREWYSEQEKARSEYDKAFVQRNMTPSTLPAGPLSNFAGGNSSGAMAPSVGSQDFFGRGITPNADNDRSLFGDRKPDSFSPSFADPSKVVSFGGTDKQTPSLASRQPTVDRSDLANFGSPTSLGFDAPTGAGAAFGGTDSTQANFGEQKPQQSAPVEPEDAPELKNPTLPEQKEAEKSSKDSGDQGSSTPDDPTMDSIPKNAITHDAKLTMLTHIQAA